MIHRRNYGGVHTGDVTAETNKFSNRLHEVCHRPWHNYVGVRLLIFLRQGAPLHLINDPITQRWD